jgi:hypothetical protein
MSPVTGEIVGVFITLSHVAPTGARTLTGYFSYPVRLMITVEKGIGLFVFALDDVNKQVLVILCV